MNRREIMKPHEKLGVAIADAGYAWTPEMRMKDGSINYIITTFARAIEAKVRGQ